MTNPTNTTNTPNPVPQPLPSTWAGLVAQLVQSVPNDFKNLAGKTVEFLGKMAQHANDTMKKEPLEPLTADQVHDLAESYTKQLDHLEDLATLHASHLQRDGAHDPTVVTLSIYALSGMREQLAADIAQFERVVQLQTQAQNQAMNPQRAATSGGLTTQIHPDHHQTRVKGMLPPPSSSFWDRVRDMFAPKDEVANRQLVRELTQVLRAFHDRAQDVQQAVRLADAKSLVDLYAPMDEFRALRDMLRQEEKRFYVTDEAA